MGGMFEITNMVIILVVLSMFIGAHEYTVYKADETGIKQSQAQLVTPVDVNKLDNSSVLGIPFIGGIFTIIWFIVKMTLGIVIAIINYLWLIVNISKFFPDVIKPLVVAIQFIFIFGLYRALWGNK